MSWQAGSEDGELELETNRLGIQAVSALLAVQRQLAQAVTEVSDEEYCQKPIGVVPSSIGGHVRHCLDHVESLLAAVRTNCVNYDDRRRGTDVESNRLSALALIGRQERELHKLASHSLDQPLRLTTLVASDRPPVEVNTTLGRELSFVLSHTVHHSSLVAVMVRLLGGEVPVRFGYAPSTIAHQEQAACVR